MIDRARLIPLTALAAALAACSGGPVAAPAAVASPLVTVPADASFLPYTCAGPTAGDVSGDPVTGGAQRDIVGDATYPAFYRSADTENIVFPSSDV